MNYRTTKETAEIWKLSARRITVLATKGRIPGAKLVGKTWLIPEDAVKPEDARYKKENNSKKEYFFPLPAFIYDSYVTAEKKLSPSQLELYKGQSLCISGYFTEADKLLSKLLDSTDDICISLGAIYFKIFTDIFLNNQESLINIYRKIQQLDLSKNDNCEELSLVLLDIKGILSGNRIYLENFKLNRNYNYSPEALPYLILLETYTSLITAYTSGVKLKPVFQESACIYMKQNKCVFSEISLHLYLAMMYKTSDDFENYLYHINYALELSEKNKTILPFIFGFKFMQNEIIEYISEHDSTILSKIPEIANVIQKNTDIFLQSINISKIYYNLTADELKLIEAARSGLTNKEIAKIQNISESYVSKKYFELCKKLEISSKKELVDTYLENLKL